MASSSEAKATIRPSKPTRSTSSKKPCKARALGAEKTLGATPKIGESDPGSFARPRRAGKQQELQAEHQPDATPTVAATAAVSATAISSVTRTYDEVGNSYLHGGVQQQHQKRQQRREHQREVHSDGSQRQRLSAGKRLWRTSSMRTASSTSAPSPHRATTPSASSTGNQFSRRGPSCASLPCQRVTGTSPAPQETPTTNGTRVTSASDPAVTAASHSWPFLAGGLNLSPGRSSESPSIPLRYPVTLSKSSSWISDKSFPFGGDGIRRAFKLKDSDGTGMQQALLLLWWQSHQLPKKHRDGVQQHLKEMSQATTVNGYRVYPQIPVDDEVAGVPGTPKWASAGQAKQTGRKDMAFRLGDLEGNVHRNLSSRVCCWLRTLFGRVEVPLAWPSYSCFNPGADEEVELDQDLHCEEASACWSPNVDSSSGDSSFGGSSQAAGQDLSHEQHKEQAQGPGQAFRHEFLAPPALRTVEGKATRMCSKRGQCLDFGGEIPSPMLGMEKA